MRRIAEPASQPHGRYSISAVAYATFCHVMIALLRCAGSGTQADGWEMIPIKTGQDHVASLRDGRDVYIYGERVADVTAHKAFRNSVRSAAALYDFQSQTDKIETMTFSSPDTGRRVNRCWQLPASYTELVERRRALETWAELH